MLAPGDRVLIVANPATRRDAAAVVATLRREAPPEIELDVRITEAAGTAAGLTRSAVEGTRLVVAVGGDGTVAEVATGLLGSTVPLGIVPGGSTNIIARQLGIPTRPVAAARLLFGRHRITRLDVGRYGERVFLHMAGAGLDSRLFARTDSTLKRRIGWPAYLPAAGRGLREPAARFRIETHEVTMAVTSPLVLVANGGAIIHPRIQLYPDLRPDDGRLDLLIFTATNPVAIARTVSRLVTLGVQRSPYLIHLSATRVTLTADPPLPIQLDGDVVGETPASFTIEPAALPIVVPA